MGKNIVIQTVKKLGEVSHSETCLDEDAFQSETKKYKGWGGMKLTQDQIHDLVTKQMVPCIESNA
jgi:hypothetical protein